MTLLRNDSSKPGTHALVIGVGRYPWLAGGGGRPKFAQHDNMGQLTSPPVSARAFSQWLLETYENPDARLASLELLLSDAKDQKFKGKTIEAATFANVSRAIADWAGRSTRDDDLLIFFFSGHGISAAVQTTLLCEDFGSQAAAPLNHAINFNLLHTALDRVAARRQCFFIDACRVASSTILETFGFFGQPVLGPVAAHNPKPRGAAVFHSTLAGQLAYGRKGKPSHFTEALLRGFSGAASDNNEDGITWWVQTDALLRALPHLLRRVADDPNQVLQQASGVDITTFRFHRLKKPPAAIPVDFSCTPDHRTARAVLSWSGGATKGKRKTPSPAAWQLDLDEGRYTFKADIASPRASGQLADAEIRPPYRNIRVKV